MGKTLIGLLEIGLAIALQFVPGLGTVAGISLGLSLGAAGLTTLLTKVPKPQTTAQALKQPIPPRVSMYGRGRLHWSYILFDVAADGWAVDVGVFHDGRMDGIERWYIGEQIVTVLSGGWILKGPGGEWGDEDTVRVGANLGLPTETAFAPVIAKMPGIWTANHRGDGCVTGFMLSKNVKAENYQKIFPYGGPNQQALSLAGRWQRVFDWRDPSQNVADDTTWKWSENAILHLAHYLLVRMGKDWSLHFVPTLDYWTAAADDAQYQMALNGIQRLLVADIPAEATSATLDSVAGLTIGRTILLADEPDLSHNEPRPVTNIVGNTVHWSLPLAWAHSAGTICFYQTDNSAVAEDRYRSCVAHQHTDAHKDTLAHLLACCDGWLSPRSDGALVVYSGRYYAPTVTIGPDEIVSYSFQDGVAEEDAINTITVSYVDQANDFNTVATDDWIDEDDVSERGKQLSDALDNQVPSHSQARRLAKRAMAKIMAPYRGSITTTSDGRTVLGQRYIHLQIIEAGSTFYDGPAEIQKVTRNLQTGGVTFDWIAADPNVDAWDPATEEGLPAPVGTRVALAPVDPPVITAAVSDFSSISTDGTGVRIDITATGPDRTDLTWFARWRPQGAAVWNDQQFSDIDPGPSVSIVTGFVPTNSMVEVEVAYRTGDARLSDYSTPATLVNTSAYDTPPDPAAVPTLTSWTSSLNMQVEQIARASAYRWNIYKADGTTLIASHSTPDRSLNYTAAIAALDGVQRSYVIGVQGANSAGLGTEAKSAVLTKAAPAAVSSPAIAGGATTATATCTALAGAMGYVTFYYNVSGFDPKTQGGSVSSGIPSMSIFGNPAGTYYGHIAAYDEWTGNPAFLNLSSEISFSITTGGGSTPSGGGSSGGGYSGNGNPYVRPP